MTIDQTTLMQIASDLCGSMLGFEVAPWEGDCPLDGTSVRATVRISGDVECMLQVDAPAASATLLGEKMFGDGVTPPDESEVLDAIGEIANIIGGNVKGIFDGECRLSLPCVGHADESTNLVDGSSTMIRIACNGEPFAISVTKAAAG